MKKYIILVLICAIYAACQSKKKDSKKNEIKNIENIYVDLNKAQKVKFSKLYDNIKWVKLQSESISLMGEIQKMEVDDDKFYFQSNNSLYIFSAKGEFITRISNQGNGPGEYLVFSDFFIDKMNNSIFIYDSKGRKINEYDYNGVFINRIDIDLDGYAFTKLDKNKFAVYIGSAYYNEKSNSRLNIIDSKGEIIKKFIRIKDNEAKFMHFGDLTNFQKFNDGVSFLYSFNDTIYSIREDKIIPRMYIDFGENKLPNRYLDKTYKDVMQFLESLKETDYAFRVIGFFESKDAIVFSFMHKYDLVHVYYSKVSKNSFIVDTFINDFSFPEIDIVSSFSNLPKASYNNNFYTIMSAYEFIDKMDKLKAKMSYSEWELYKIENVELFSIYESTDIDDNPMIVVGKLNKF
ncbi:6-bladed beta-propeller [Confluentibacter sediminis]|uniref:6-bladed beta-propeller n=1 Tax=Confluentibacter sediminis TaxID=2219045 RepID=UPI000DAC618B|nr:6-bladed beta-propeller [Confluentibacter sediminis]